jgi:hypothetical protein
MLNLSFPFTDGYVFSFTTSTIAKYGVYVLPYSIPCHQCTPPWLIWHILWTNLMALHTTISILHPQLPKNIFTNNMIPLYLLINYQDFLLTRRHHLDSHLLAIFLNRIMGHCHLVHLIKVRSQSRIMVNEKTNKLVNKLWNVKQKT